jgi:hypothetical protein
MEGARPSIVITHQIAAALRRGVIVSGDILAERGVCLLAAPSLREGDEESLLAGQAVANRIASAVQRKSVGVVRDC